MALVPNDDFTAGQIFTATEANAFGRGVLGYESLTTSFSTSATHTTFQDEGLDASISYGANRILKVTLSVRPYPNGGLQSMLYRVLRGSTEVAKWVVESVVLSAGSAGHYMLEQVFTGPATSGTETFKVQVCAGSNNTQVTSYGSTVAGDGPRQFWVEDLGKA